MDEQSEEQATVPDIATRVQLLEQRHENIVRAWEHLSKLVAEKLATMPDISDMQLRLECVRVAGNHPDGRPLEETARAVYDFCKGTGATLAA